ncbi:zinc finger HIT domain-containing protein 3-like [Xyrauchen texanus]|uniref:zinc finger HIT domain-containing protein 3-like n=1 Tax=Xyrauchen texanus TaxID=154827 RepID=UPI0022421114|nr:zinc finger HIT domain-containing protein 3-like [Xyrauchen texanus]
MLNHTKRNLITIVCFTFPCSCSVSCFKRHKDADSCHPVKETAAPVSTPTTPVSSAELPWTVDDLLDEDSQSDKVPLQKLQRLGESEALKALLWNPHLRQVMMSVDSAEDKAKAVRNAMQEPLFVEFADQCLRTIEPAQTEEKDDDDDDDE